MNIKLHHLNLCSKDVSGMEDFYRSVLDLQPEPSLSSARNTAQGYAAPGHCRCECGQLRMGRGNHAMRPTCCLRIGAAASEFGLPRQF